MMILLFLAGFASAAEGGTDELSVKLSKSPCLQKAEAVVSADLESVRWPFKAVAAHIALRAQAQRDAHIEECSRILLASDDQRLTFVATKATIDQGRAVSADMDEGTLATDEAATMHETPAEAFYGGYGQGYIVGGGTTDLADLTTARNIGFLQGQMGGGVYGGGAESVAKANEDAEKRRLKAEADAAARKAAAEAKAKADSEARARAIREAGGS